MLTRWPLLVAAALLAYAGYRWSQDPGGDWVQAAGDVLDETGNTIMNAISGYSASRVPEQYREAIGMAETKNSLPDGMLARLLWQESRYSARIISGEKKSPAGAVGIAQFMPATAREMGVDPTDPYQSIAAAGRYLASLYRQTGDWAETLAAYNWGVGNVKRKGLAAAPLETRNYYAQIMGDIGMA